MAAGSPSQGNQHLAKYTKKVVCNASPTDVQQVPLPFRNIVYAKLLGILVYLLRVRDT